MIHSKYRVIAIITFLTNTLSACSTSPAPNLYIIEPVSAVASAGTDQAPSIAVAAVTIPPYLDRKEIVTHSQRYQIKSAEFDRWAEPLDQNIANTLAENLSVFVPSDQVVAYPWDPAQIFDYTVRVRVIKFGASPGGIVELSATWLILDSNNESPKLTKTHYVADRQGDDVLSLVAAMSDAIEQLSRDIANALTADSI